MIIIQVVSAGLACTAPRPLLVELRNPEGNWIRTYSVSTQQRSLTVPELTSRYYFEIRAADAGCSGLVYELIVKNGGAGGGGGGELAGDVALCRIAHNNRVEISVRLRSLERKRRALRNPAARRRYARYITTQRRKLTHARAYERRRCANV